MYLLLPKEEERRKRRDSSGEISFPGIGYFDGIGFFDNVKENINEVSEVNTPENKTPTDGTKQQETEKSKEKKNAKKKERSSKLDENAVNELKISRKLSSSSTENNQAETLPKVDSRIGVRRNSTSRNRRPSFGKASSDSSLYLNNNLHLKSPTLYSKSRSPSSKEGSFSKRPSNESLNGEEQAKNNNYEELDFYLNSKFKITNTGDSNDESDEEIKRAMSNLVQPKPPSTLKKSPDNTASKRRISVVDRSDYMRFFDMNTPITLKLNGVEKNEVSEDTHETQVRDVEIQPNSPSYSTVASLEAESRPVTEIFETRSIIEESEAMRTERSEEFYKSMNDDKKELELELSDNVSLTEDEKIPPDIMEPAPKPKWHPPWQLKQEIIAHTDAIPVLQIDPSNRWFATGSSDKTVRIWDINDGGQKLVINAHKQSIRAMTFGLSGHRQLFTTADDRQLLCHDIEVNRIVSQYKGQSAVIYGMCTYQPSHLLVTAARDKVLKVYDTRTTKCIKTLRGHQNTVSCVIANEQTKQIISGSHDGTLRLWDIGEGKCTGLLQGHSKSVRGLTAHPDGDKILSASTERILAWKLPLGDCFQEILAEDIAINSVTINHLGVTVAGGSNGVINIWDFKSGHMFQKINRTKVYESQEIPICVFTTKFDHSGSKLICSDACNVVKIYKEAYTKVGKRHRFKQANEFTDIRTQRTQSNIVL